MKIHKTIAALLILFLFSCSAWKKELKQNGNNNELINNVIIDFINTSNLYKKNRIFSVSIEDFKLDEIVIIILPSENKFLPETEDTIGTNISYLPTNFFELNNKLFYWRDSTKTLSADAVNILNKYNLIDSTNVNGFQYLPYGVYTLDDAQKAVTYYICKNDFTNYKKVTSSIAYGFYDPPKLKCNK